MKPKHYTFSTLLSIAILLSWLVSAIQTRPTLAVSPDLYAEDFEGYAVGADPDNWFDTDIKNSMVENDSLFRVSEIDGNKVFGTTSTGNNCLLYTSPSPRDRS